MAMIHKSRLSGMPRCGSMNVRSMSRVTVLNTGMRGSAMLQIRRMWRRG